MQQGQIVMLRMRLLTVLVVIGCARFVLGDDALFERAPIKYSTCHPNDPVALLQQQIDSGRIKLNYDAQCGYLSSLLKTLGIPVSSQEQVNTKTNKQRELINTGHPRALYFNDDVY